MGPRPSLYTFAGGEAAFLRLARAHHARCIADAELNHPFSHPGQHPEHVARLAAYWAEVMGGPTAYSTSHGGTQTKLQKMHSGNGDMTDLGRRFVACFTLALDDAQLPADPAFRTALRAYMEWAVEDVLQYSAVGSRIPERLRVPRWDWSGLVDDGR